MDNVFLRELAEKSQGNFVDESKANQLIDEIVDELTGSSLVVEKPLVYTGPWFLLMVLLILAIE